MTTKQCITCGSVKSIDKFYFTDRKRGYRKKECDECDNIRRMERYYLHQEDEILRAAEYRENNPEQTRKNIYTWRKNHRSEYNAYMRQYNKRRNI